jgi:L-aspartate oxidase
MENLEKTAVDVVVVGCGAAGLYAALNLDPSIQCLVINKSGPEHSNSMYAQGGIATVIEPYRDNDSPSLHCTDTLVAGAGLCDEAAVDILVNEAWDNIKGLIEMKVPFDISNGEILLTREGGHSKNRILHSGGDATGFHMTSRLYEITKKRRNITIMDRLFLTDILTDEFGVTGIIVLDEQEKPRCIVSSKVIIASGGIGRVYRNSTNAVCATGDGIAAAARAGAAVKDMEFVQFHPTGMIHPDETGRYFLVSEALRGEGAILRNREWKPFMQGEHPLADLAPRDIVSRSIIKEMKRSNIPHVYLDITSKSRDFLKKRFPTIYGECMRRGLDIAKDWIPVVPVQHYFMGGIRTDVDGRTNIPGLYACGEAACTGIHGANRLASNSLLECLVFARRCVRDISRSGLFMPEICPVEIKTYKKRKDIDYDPYRSEIRQLTTLKCGIMRNGKDLSEAKSRVAEIRDELEELELRTRRGIETYNQSSIALAIIEASLARKGSVGAHFRTDSEG